MQDRKPIGLKMHTAFAFTGIYMIFVLEIIKNQKVGPTGIEPVTKRTWVLFLVGYTLGDLLLKNYPYKSFDQKYYYLTHKNFIGWSTLPKFWHGS